MKNSQRDHDPEFDGGGPGPWAARFVTRRPLTTAAVVGLLIGLLPAVGPPAWTAAGQVPGLVTRLAAVVTGQTPTPQVGGVSVFATPLDYAASNLAAPYNGNAGAGTLILTPNTGTRFGTPTPSAPIRVTVIPASALDSASRITNPAAVATYRVTARAGDVLSGLTLESGNDQPFPTGSYAAVLKTARTDADQNWSINVAERAILALQTTTAPLTSPAFAGTPTLGGSPLATQGWVRTNAATLTSPAFLGTPTLSGSPLATQAWVQAQGGGGGGAGGASGAVLGYFDVRDYGAVPGAATDNRASFQAANDAASAAVQAAVNAGIKGARAVLFVPSGAAPFYLKSGPVWLSPGVCVTGGNTFSTQGYAFVVGLQSLESLALNPADYRPSSNAVLDASAQGRNGFSSAAGAVLSFPCHPLQMGTTDPAYPGSNIPDYWASSTAITIEFCVTLPTGYAWPNQDTFFGTRGIWGNTPDPWFVQTRFGGGAGFSFDHYDADGPDLYASSSAFRVAQFTAPDGTLGTYRVIIQYDTVSGTASFWCNTTAGGRPVKQTAAYTYGGAPDPGPGAGHGFAASSAITPFQIGAANGGLPNAGGSMIPGVYHGLRVTRGKLYDTTGAPGSAPVFSEPSLVGQTVNDLNMYFQVVNGTARTVSLLDTSAPAKSWVPTNNYSGAGTGVVLVAAQAPGVNGGNVFQGANVQSAGEAPILVSGLVERGLLIDDCYLQGAYRALTWNNCGYTQPAMVSNSILNGSDTAVYASNAFLTVKDCMYGGGREGMRFYGGVITVNNSWQGAFTANWRNGIQANDNGYGQGLAVYDSGFDNEGGVTPSHAFVDFRLAQYPQPVVLTVRQLGVSALGTAPFVALTGVASQNNTGYVEVSGLNDFGWAGELAATVFRADGAGLWWGKVDLLSLHQTATAGTGLGNLTITHR